MLQTRLKSPVFQRCLLPIWGNTLCLQIVPCSCPYEALWRVVRHTFLSLPRKESEDDVVSNMRITQRNHDKINKIINLTVQGVFTFKRSKSRKDLCYIFHLTYCHIFPSSSNPLKCYWAYFSRLSLMESRLTSFKINNLNMTPSTDNWTVLSAF